MWVLVLEHRRDRHLPKPGDLLAHRLEAGTLLALLGPVHLEERKLKVAPQLLPLQFHFIEVPPDTKEVVLGPQFAGWPQKGAPVTGTCCGVTDVLALWSGGDRLEDGRMDV